MPPASKLLGFNAARLKVQLKLAVNRLRLLQQKKAALNAAQRKEISLLLEAGKVESARVRVEHIIREDYLIETLEILELYCELLSARFGLIETMSECDPGIQEAVHTIIYAAPRSEVKELHQVRDQLAAKYGKDFAVSAMENRGDLVSQRVIQKLKVQTPSSKLVTQYLKAIGKAYNIKWDEPPSDDEDDDEAGNQKVAAAAAPKNVREDPTGTYQMYDASTTGFTPSNDAPSDPAAPKVMLRQHPPRKSSALASQMMAAGPGAAYYMDGTPMAAAASPAMQPTYMYMAPDGSLIPAMAPPTYAVASPAQLPAASPSPMPMPAPMPMPSPAAMPQPMPQPAPAMPVAPSASGTFVGGGGSTELAPKESPTESGVSAGSPEFPTIPRTPPKQEMAAPKEPTAPPGDAVPDFDELAKRFEALKNRK